MARKSKRTTKSTKVPPEAKFENLNVMIADQDKAK